MELFIYPSFLVKFNTVFMSLLEHNSYTEVPALYIEPILPGVFKLCSAISAVIYTREITINLDPIKRLVDFIARLNYGRLNQGSKYIMWCVT